MDPTLTDPFTPPAQTPANTSNVAGEWAQALNDPKVQSTLLQFGISMLQPPSFGDTTGSQIGRAIGDSGEALTRQDEAARKQQETDSKQTLRESQATAAEARAASAGARNDAASSRLDLAREKLGLTEILARNKRQMEAANAYQSAKTKYEARRVYEPNLPPFPAFGEWATQTGVASMLGTGDAGESPPADPAQRQPGKVYQTPKGPLRYLGNGNWSTP